MRSVKIPAMLILTAMLMNSCGAIRQPIKPQTTPVTHRGEGWMASEQEPNVFLIIARDSAAQTAAMKELCPKEYICFDGYVGEASTVERRKK